MFQSIGHCCNRDAMFIEKACKEPEEWQHYLNKSACGQYWTGITNHRMTNYVMLDKNGDVIRDAKEFRPYYLIFSSFETVGVYCAQDRKFARNKILRFNKRGLSTYQECMMYAPFEALGPSEQMADKINKNVNHYNNKINVR